MDEKTDGKPRPDSRPSSSGSGWYPWLSAPPSEPRRRPSGESSPPPAKDSGH
ncbi:MAG: hypothetical protein H6712_04990 [Myxococcales bacterium]|nr:hypothetical protein [Myxococcales bacterium]MCB9713187.1 hypothetical protein [Myxococcales bacterium]